MADIARQMFPAEEQIYFEYDNTVNAQFPPDIGVEFYIPLKWLTPAFRVVDNQIGQRCMKQ